MMDRKQKLFRIFGTLAVAVLLAGAVCDTLLSAVGMSPAAHWAYLGALAGAAVCAMCAFSMPTAIAGALAAVFAGGAWALSPADAAWSARGLISAIDTSRTVGISALSASAGALSLIAAALISVIMYVLLSDRGAATTALAACAALGACVVCCAVNEALPIWHALPAFIGACAALANSAEQRGTLGHIKALFPALLAVMLAFAIAPKSGVTYAPLEDAATYVKQLYEDYFNYTQERVAFSITDRGYDYYGLMNGEPTHLLGGPANPSDAIVMRVETDSELLLRGTVRGTYTGYSWEDYTAKARHLYYDFTRRARRNSVFNVGIADDIAGYDEALVNVKATVTMLADAPSTLFVPGRLTDFSMDMRNAVYYNTVGEMFIARDVVPGDTYSFASENVRDYSALAALQSSARLTGDEGYAEAAALYLQLPDGIEPGVYSVTQQITEGAESDAEKALLIMDALKKNCAYSTEVGYPPTDRDFVSYFLLETREGYCSYFATAMTVMCRISGIPARYVEGYRVSPEEDGSTNVTGEDAHAWCEVYLRGVGWIAYDPTPGQANGGGGGADPDPSIEPTQTPVPPVEGSPEPTEPPAESSAEPSVPPSAEPSGEPMPPPEAPENTPQPTEDTPPDAENDKKSGAAWLIILIILIILALLGALCAWIKSKLDKSDPVRLAARDINPDRNVMMLYRAILTLLSAINLYPAGGESPESFAERVSRSGAPNPDFEEFAKVVTVLRYSRARASKEHAALGLRAYIRFAKQLRRADKIRFYVKRALKGLGRFDQIP